MTGVLIRIGITPFLNGFTCRPTECGHLLALKDDEQDAYPFPLLPSVLLTVLEASPS